LAERWVCSEAHVYNLVRRGEVMGFKAGRVWRVPLEEIARVERGEPVNNDRRHAVANPWDGP
jgi:hypothetical protein